jgi:hypothetical protein
MPMKLEGSCRCGAVSFTVDSHTPYPYQRCYCSICRKTDGGGGYAINIMGNAKSLKVRGKKAIRIFRAEIKQEDGSCVKSSARRHFCSACATALWVSDPEWPELMHPFASAVDTDLPVPPSKVHLMLRYKASWVVPNITKNDKTFDEYPDQSIEDWHRERGLWID